MLYLESIFEFVTGFVNLSTVPKHAAESQVAIDVVRALQQDVFVQPLGFIMQAKTLIHSSKVVADCNAYFIVVAIFISFLLTTFLKRKVL